MEQMLLMEYRHLGPEETVAGKICPFCNGGANQDKSFSITRKADGNLIYYCHRDKCHSTGIIARDGSSIIRTYPKEKKHKVFDEPTIALTELQLEFFLNQYGINPEELGNAGFLYAPTRKAVWQPVYSPERRLRGQVLYRYSDKKISTYKLSEESREPLISWYKPFLGKEIVLVEDQLSAIKLARYWNTVALLGTGLSKEAIIEIARYSTKQYLALDRDAIATALTQQRRWRNLLDIEIVETRRDPKYWENCQLKALNEDITPF